MDTQPLPILRPFGQEILQNEDIDALATEDKRLELLSETRKCISVPFVPSNYFQSNEVAEKLATLIKKIRVQSTKDISGNEHKYDPKEASICKFFVKRNMQPGQPVLVFPFISSKKGCKNGDACFFSHDLEQSTSSSYRPTLCLPEAENVHPASLLRLFPTSSYGCILLLDDTYYHFSSHLSHHYDPSKIISTTCLSDDSEVDPSLSNVRILCGLSHPSQTIISKASDSLIPWNEVTCVLWFPKLGGDIENLEEQKSLVQTFFDYLAIRILGDALHEVQVILTMNNIQFSQLQVEKLGRESFFPLESRLHLTNQALGSCPAQ